MFRAAGIAAVVAAAVLLALGLPWRAPNPTRVRLGWVLGVAAGFLLGCRALDLGRHWPPVEDQDRFLFVLVPATVVVECVAAFGSVPRWAAWLLRLLIAAGAAPLLLYNSIYLTGLASPGSRPWSPGEAGLTLAALAAALATVWAALARLQAAAPGRSVPLALAGACGGAGVVVMLSGYLTGGQMGLPLAAALAGATVASLALPGAPGGDAPIGLGVVGLFGVLVVGHFFGTLTPTQAVLLFFAAALCWLPEAPPLRRLRSWARGTARVALVLIPVAFALAEAKQRFDAESQATSSSQEPSLQDYLDYGK
jgi:hypothetical protein